MSDSAKQTGLNIGKTSMTVDEARQYILDNVSAIDGVENLAVRSALGRVLHEDILSPINVPSSVNSAMDGYALAGSDLPKAGTAQLKVVGTVLAGQQPDFQVNAGECARIMTGATIPPGTDTVIMQEQVTRSDEVISIDDRHRVGQNVRQAGEDLAIGEVAIAAGKTIMPPELGLIASLGYPEVRVNRQLRVAFFSTGDELRSIGEPLREGDVYDSNRYTIFGMLTRLGANVIDMGVIPDQRDAIRQAFLDAAELADVVITSGGVSVGEADFVKDTLDELGEIMFWKIAMKPGRPLAFGQLKNAMFFGLPGNPVAVMVSFYQFVQPALQKMMGKSVEARPCLMLPIQSAIRKRAGRTEFLRAYMYRNEQGVLVVDSTGQQGSGILSSMSRANCFIILEHEQEDVAVGDAVLVEPFSSFM